MIQSASLPLTSASRWGIVIMLMVYAGLGHFNRVGISVAGSEIFIPQLKISETQMGWVYTSFLIVYTLCMLPGGWLIDRIGSGRALALFGMTMGLFVMLTGVLGWLMSTAFSLWVGLLIVRGLAGIGNAPLHPGAAHVVSELMTDESRATANGMVTAGALIGIACCYPVLGWLIDQLGWKWAIVLSGGVLIAFGCVWKQFVLPLLLTRTVPAGPDGSVTANLLNPGPTESGQADSNALPSKSLSDGNEHADIWPMLANRNLWLLSLSYAAYGYFQYLFFYWMSYYFETVLHIPDVEARHMSFYIMLSQGGGMAIGGLSTDFFCRRLGTAMGRRCVVMTGMGLGALFGLIGVSMKGHVDVAMFLALSMGSLGMCEGVFWTTATDIGGKAKGFSGAFMNTLGNVGGFISPVLTPYLAKEMGWYWAIVLACFITALGGLVWFLINLAPAPDQSPGTAEVVST